MYAFCIWFVIPSILTYFTITYLHATNKKLDPEIANCLKIVMIYLNFVIKSLLNKVLLHLNTNKTMQKNTAILVFVFLLHTYCSFSQKTDSTKSFPYVSGAVSVTNNGISIVPSFSLGKPAVQFNMYMVKKRLSFEPDIRFSLKGKPWSMLFWGRYKVVTSNKFNMNVGAHLGLNFRTSS